MNSVSSNRIFREAVFVLPLAKPGGPSGHDRADILVRTGAVGPWSLRAAPDKGAMAFRSSRTMSHGP